MHSGMQCSPPPSIKHGKYVLNTSFSNSIGIGSTAVYSCEKGYGLENATEDTLKCHLSEGDNDAKWKGNLPTCKSKVLWLLFLLFKAIFFNKLAHCLSYVCKK